MASPPGPPRARPLGPSACAGRQARSRGSGRGGRGGRRGSRPGATTRPWCRRPPRREGLRPRQEPRRVRRLRPVEVGADQAERVATGETRRLDRLPVPLLRGEHEDLSHRRTRRRRGGRMLPALTVATLPFVVGRLARNADDRARPIRAGAEAGARRGPRRRASPHPRPRSTALTRRPRRPALADHVAARLGPGAHRLLRGALARPRASGGRAAARGASTTSTTPSSTSARHAPSCPC